MYFSVESEFWAEDRKRGNRFSILKSHTNLKFLIQIVACDSCAHDIRRLDISGTAFYRGTHEDGTVTNRKKNFSYHHISLKKKYRQCINVSDSKEIRRSISVLSEQCTLISNNLAFIQSTKMSRKNLSVRDQCIS